MAKGAAKDAADATTAAAAATVDAAALSTAALTTAGTVAAAAVASAAGATRRSAEPNDRRIRTEVRRSVARPASFDEAAAMAAGAKEGVETQVGWTAAEVAEEEWRQSRGLALAKDGPSHHAHRSRHSHHSHRSKSVAAESKSSAEKKAGKRRQRVPSSMVELSLTLILTLTLYPIP